MYILLLCLIGSASCYISRTNMLPGKSTIVHLFEWKWSDIADECERFLGPHGFGGVQVSPASENLIIHLDDGSRPWYERYQVMSYKIETRSGNEADFLNMSRRCNDVGVRIYVDVVINHMTANYKDNVGTAGSTADFGKNQYYGVPYGPSDFHSPCSINNFNNVEEVRNCRLDGLKDLNQTTEYVRTKIGDYVNKLISHGVAGLSFHAAANYTEIQNWWDNGYNQIAFSRGNNAFVVFNLEGRDLNTTLQTGLPEGNYCDVITGKRQDNKCSGKMVTVNHEGKANIYLPGNAEDLHLAIHVGPESSLACSSCILCWGEQ